MYKNSRAIIFGGSGFLGSHIADELSRHGLKVTIFDKKKSKYNSKDQKMIVGDHLNISQVNQAIKGNDYVFHFSGVADIYEANENPLKAVLSNINSTGIILNSAVKNKVKRFVFASSIYVFSEQGGIYRSTKQACELI